ncbi:MAG: single-stranded DNA-binding protein [Pseudonocardiaceae bacterium]
MTLQGNLARDPQALTSSGKTRTRLVIAVNYGFGERQKVDYIDVTMFGTTAENASRFLTKGPARAPVRPKGQYVIVVARPVSGLDISTPLVVQAFATYPVDSSVRTLRWRCRAGDERAWVAATCAREEAAGALGPPRSCSSVTSGAGECSATTDESQRSTRRYRQS